MRIGILGGGNVGGALGVAWAKNQVCFGVRKPDSPEMQDVLARCGSKGQAGTAAEAAAFADVILNALPWKAVKETLSGLDLNGKTLLDASNPVKEDLSGLELGQTTSAGEAVAGWAPGAKVVKVFNTTGSNNMENPVYNSENIPMFYCSDDPAAKAVAADLVQAAGFSAVDAGPLSNARLLEPLAMLWIWLAYPGGLGREFAFHIVKR